MGDRLIEQLRNKNNEFERKIEEQKYDITKIKLENEKKIEEQQNDIIQIKLEKQNLMSTIDELKKECQDQDQLIDRLITKNNDCEKKIEEQKNDTIQEKLENDKKMEEKQNDILQIKSEKQNLMTTIDELKKEHQD